MKVLVALYVLMTFNHENRKKLFNFLGKMLVRRACELMAKGFVRVRQVGKLFQFSKDIVSGNIRWNSFDFINSDGTLSK